MAWTATVHYANVETATTAYDEVNVTTVAALSGYGSYDLSIFDVSEAIEVEGALGYANGSLRNSRTARYSYNLQLIPSDFKTERHNVTQNLAILAKKKFLWLELNTLSQDALSNVGDTQQYHATGKCIPVVIDGISTTTNYESGTKGATITFKRRFKA